MADILTTREKALKVDDALRTERHDLRMVGNLKAANAINKYLQEADEDSKARFYDILTA